MIFEWQKRNPTAFSSMFQKNKDGKMRCTSSEIVKHLKRNVFSKKQSRVRRSAHEYVKKKLSE